MRIRISHTIKANLAHQQTELDYIQVLLKLLMVCKEDKNINSKLRVGL